jgi:hypothetical protein
MAAGEPHESSDAPARQPSRHAVGGNPGWSGVPLAASLALVAFAIFFGVYGPRVGDRITPPLGIPAWDLGEAAAERFHERRNDAVHGEGAGQTSIVDAERDVRALLGASVRLPDLVADGWTVHVPKSVAVPGSARSVAVNFSRSLLGGVERLSLLLVPDKEQYVVFSPFGRPLFLPPWEAYPIEFPQDSIDDAVALLWSDGSVIRVLVARSESVLAETAPAFFTASRPESLVSTPDAERSALPDEGTSDEPKAAEK